MHAALENGKVKGYILVYTHPNHRNKEYATIATSAITEEAFRNAE